MSNYDTSNSANDKFEPTEHQHIRFNPLQDEWILVSPHRCKRPWQGQLEKVVSKSIPEFDLNNPLCPGATRPNGQVNPKYESTFVFPNDFPALVESCPEPESDESEDELFKTVAARGTCKVICFHPKSNISIPLMSISEITNVINTWTKELIELGKKYTWVQIFENKGEMMGCSNPHPHCQVWASSFLPNEARAKDKCQKEYFDKHKVPLLIRYAEKEMKLKERIVLENENWIVVVPYWAVWPYETMILPKRHIQRMTDLTAEEKTCLSDAIKKLTIKYDNLFKTAFPYSMGWHGAPTGEFLQKDCSHWVFHGIYFPPLLRSSTIRKFMVGYELLAQPQRDLTPEQAAEKLRSLPQHHYSIAEHIGKSQL